MTIRVTFKEPDLELVSERTPKPHQQSFQFDRSPLITVNNFPTRSKQKKSKRKPESKTATSEVIERAMSETHEPLDHPNFFQGPLSTLSASLQEESAVTLIEIAEAYAVLTGRIRMVAKSLLEKSTTPAIENLRNNARTLLQVLRRDIDRCREPPFPRQRIGSSEPLHEMTSAQLKASRDVAIAANYALVLLSDFFRLPALHGILSLSQSIVLLKTVLDVGMKENLLSYNAAKTHKVVVWILRTQMLPYSVLQPLRSSMTEMLRNAIQGKLGSDKVDGPVLDGLKTLAMLLRRFPEGLTSHFASILPLVLENLHSGIEVTRFATCDCLCAFAESAANGHANRHIRQLLSTHINEFFKERLFDADKDRALSFTDLLSRSVIDPEGNRSYALVPLTMAACIVTSGPYIFLHPYTMAAVKRTLGDLKRSRRPAIATLLSCIWRCLLFAFAQLDLFSEMLLREIEEKAFSVIKEETSADFRLSVIALCLGKNEAGETSKQKLRALSILKNIVETPPCRTIAIEILHRITFSTPGDRPSQWTDTCIIPENLLDKGSLTELHGKALRKKIEQIPPFSLSHLRCLNEDEINDHWLDLFQMWQDLVLKEFHEDSPKLDLQSELLDIWQSLLLAQGTLSQGGGHLTSSETVKSHVTETLRSILKLPKDENNSTWRVKQNKILTVVQSLWKILCNCFGRLYLHDTAKEVLSTLLTTTFDTSNCDIEQVYSFLVDSLILTWDEPRALWGSSLPFVERQNTLRVFMWKLEAKVFSVENGKRPVAELADYLSRPLQWELEETALDIWKSLFDVFFKESIEKSDFLCQLLSRLIERDDIQRSSSALAFFRHILETLSTILDAHDECHHFSHIGSFLKALYPPDPAILPIALETFLNLRKLASSVVNLGVQRSQTFYTIQLGLVQWLEDKKCAIPGDAYDEYIMPVYSDILECLRTAGVTDEAITTFTDILVAPMERSPLSEGAIGPILLKKFWDNVYPSLTLSEFTCPERLVDCVRVLIEHLGEEIPSWMESESSIEHHADVSIPADAENTAKGKERVILAQQRPPRPIDEVSEEHSVDLDADSHHRKRRKTLTIEIPSLPADDSPLFDTHEMSGAEKESENSITSEECEPSTSYSLGEIGDRETGKVGGSDSIVIASDDGIEKSAILDEALLNQSNAAIHNASAVLDEVVPESPISIVVTDEEELPRVLPSPVRQIKEEVDETVDSSNLTTSHRIERTQTAPSILRSSSGNFSPSPQRPTTLRRAQTTPVKAHEVLLKLGEDVDYMETQELANAARGMTELLGKITARITTKLTESRGQTPNCDE